jgi:hypothetical protein
MSDKKKSKKVYIYNFGSSQTGVIDTNVFSSLKKLKMFLSTSKHHIDIKKMAFESYLKNPKLVDFGCESHDEFYIEIRNVEIDNV